MQAFSIKYPVLTSAIHTFLATFLVTIIANIATIPTASILAASTWTTSAIAGILVAGARAGIKAVSPLS